MTPEDEPGGVIAYRLASMEKAIGALRVDMDRRFESLDGRLGTLEFVRKDVYDVRHEELRSMLKEEIESRKAADKATLDVAERNSTMTIWNFGILMMLILILIGAAVKVLAG